MELWFHQDPRNVTFNQSVWNPLIRISDGVCMVDPTFPQRKTLPEIIPPLLRNFLFLPHVPTRAYKTLCTAPRSSFYLLDGVLAA